MIKASRIKQLARDSGFGFVRLWLSSVAILAVALPLSVSALTSISQGFSATEAIALGSIVSLKNNTSDQVIAASTSNVDNLYGVAINDGSSLLTLSNGQANQVQVATSGIVSVLVSDINGDIVQGDQITASPIKGVGMKATSNTKVVGIAQGTPISNGSNSTDYTDAQGKKQPLILGEVPVLVSAAYYFKTPEKTLIPSAIQNMANALAGKTVNAAPILVSAAIFLVTLIVVVSIIYAMIRSSIISVGRNPMSQSAVYRDVIQLSALVLGILAVALISIYVILTRF
ncbi:MAG: hypothetical protein ABI716_01115 [Candidatus Saccharibacteria bacterium]